MAIYGQSLTIQYIAWDTANNTGKTGDAANHTLRWVRDGVAAAPTNSPSEVDATNAPGVYKLTLTATETSCWVGTLCGKSSTTGVVIMPITLTFERLPTAAPGASGGLPVIGSVPLAYLDASVSSRLAASAYEAPDNASIAAIKAQTDRLSFTGSDVKATLDGEQVTVGGYASGQSPQEALTAQGYTTTRAANLDNLDAAVSSRAAPGDAMTLTSDYDRAKNALSHTEYVAPDNTSIAAIKAKTDQLSFTGGDVKATLDGEQVTVGGYTTGQSPQEALTAQGYTSVVRRNEAGGG